MTISQRLDALENIHKQQKWKKNVKTSLGRLGDFERQINVIFLYASKLQLKKHPTLREINLSRMTSLKQLLEKFLETYKRLIEFEKDCRDKFSSERLLQLVTSVQKKKGLLPDIETLVQDLEAITE